MPDLPVIGCFDCPATRIYDAAPERLTVPLVEFLAALAPGNLKPVAPLARAWTLVTGDGPPRVYCPTHMPPPPSLVGIYALPEPTEAAA